jgi:hypothetical protein
VAYNDYTRFLKKVRAGHAAQVAERRIRVSSKRKVYVLFSSAVRNQLGVL